MVYESRVGEVIALGATSWRVEEIRPDRVVVSPAPGVPGKIPFWHGDGLGRPIELGRAMGEFVRELEGDLARGERGRERARRRLLEHHDLDDLAAENVLAYLAEEREMAGSLPTDRRIVVERFRDELGDWRIVVLTPFGGRVHAPWALAIESRLDERLGGDAQTIWSDDGIAIRLPEGEVARDGRGGGDGGGHPGDGGRRSATARSATCSSRRPRRSRTWWWVGSGASAMFAARFRENAARALLLPRRRPGSRTPLWHAAPALGRAAGRGQPVRLVPDHRRDLSRVPGRSVRPAALREVLGGVARREIEVRDVETVSASPFAGSLLFDYLAAYMYEGDAPLAERRAGRAGPRPRPAARAARPGGAARPDRPRGPGRPGAGARRRWCRSGRPAPSTRCTTCCAGWATWPQEEVGGPDRGAGRRDGVAGRAGGVAPGGRPADRRRRSLDRDRGRGPVPRRPGGGPAGRAFRRPSWRRSADALGGLLARWARSHGPFHAAEAARRWALPVARVEEALEKLLATGTILRGEFRPGGTEREWCDPEVLRQLRRRSLARLRREVEPVEQVRPGPVPARLAGRPARRRCRRRPSAGARRRLERLAEVVDQLAGLPIPASVLERDVLPARIPGYQPRLLDELGALGEVAWVGDGRLGRDDGRIVLYRPGRLEPWRDPVGVCHRVAVRRAARAIRDCLARAGASFYRELRSAAGTASERDVLDALWELVWAGEVTNDTFAPLGRCAGGDPRARGDHGRAGCRWARRRRPGAGRSWRRAPDLRRPHRRRAGRVRRPRPGRPRAGSTGHPRRRVSIPWRRSCSTGTAS